MIRFDLGRFLLVFMASVLVFLGEVQAQKSPLIMKHADSLAVARKRGSLLLQGRVHFIHDSVNVRTQRATWNKDGEVVACEGGFQFTHPSGWIDAKQGVYQKKKGIASATGDVHAGDSAKTYYATGEYVEYDKEHEILTMPEKPVLYYYDKKDTVRNGKQEVQVDTVTVVAKRIVYNKKETFAEGKGDASITHKDVSIKADEMTYDRKIDYARGVGNVVITHDSVTVYADRINYNKKDDFAEAFNNVKVTQEDMVVTCDTGYFDRKNNWMSMKGNPKCELKNYNLTGDSIFLTLDSSGKSLKSALVIRNAHGLQQEDAKRNSPGSVTEAFGDTLYAQFDGNKIERLYVNLNARGFFYEKDLDNYRNNMNGDRLDMYFENGKMHHAIVSGKAQSTYYYVKKDRSVSGRNEAAGDTIYIKFDPRKNAVKTLRMLGGSTTPSSGRYVDMEKENRNKKNLTESAPKADIADKPVDVVGTAKSKTLKAATQSLLKAKRPQEASQEKKK
ncbi:OstA-like protein [Fibrobacter sp. UWR4]|nr:OstA-like protein [Fibrobacter sp. UWR4]PZW73387.1 OstA-like protein [Fibrobacter sp. UWR1]